MLGLLAAGASQGQEAGIGDLKDGTARDSLCAGHHHLGGQEQDGHQQKQRQQNRQHRPLQGIALPAVVAVGFQDLQRYGIGLCTAGIKYICQHLAGSRLCDRLDLIFFLSEHDRSSSLALYGFCQHIPSALEIALHGADGNIHHSGNLFDFHVAIIPQNNGL